MSDAMVGSLEGCAQLGPFHLLGVSLPLQMASPAGYSDFLLGLQSKKEEVSGPLKG